MKKRPASHDVDPVQKVARLDVMSSKMAILTLACTALLTSMKLVPQALAQSAGGVPAAIPSQATAANVDPAANSAQPAAGAPGPSWIVFDRTTGRWYRQQLVPQRSLGFQPGTSTQPDPRSLGFQPGTNTQPDPRSLGFQPGTNTQPDPRSLGFQPGSNTQLYQLVQTEIAPPTGGLPLGAVAINPQPIFQLVRRGGTLQPNTSRPPLGKLPTRLSRFATVPAPRMAASSMMAAAPPSVAQQPQAQQLQAQQPQAQQPQAQQPQAQQPQAQQPQAQQPQAQQPQAQQPQAQQLQAQQAQVQRSGSQPAAVPPPTLPQTTTPTAPAPNLTAGVYPQYPAYQPSGPFPLPRSLRTGLRPITPLNGPFSNLLQPLYPAPLSAGPVNRTATRDETQAGLAPTILR